MLEWGEFVDLLDVHHIDSNRNNNVLDNLVILCPLHHATVTRGYAHFEGRKYVTGPSYSGIT